MIYVSIDAAKVNHFASAMSSDNKILFEPFRFTNDNDGFSQFMSKLISFEKDELIIDLESMAHYGNTSMFLDPKEFQIVVSKPI